jgi:hypothetical protein
LLKPLSQGTKLFRLERMTGVLNRPDGVQKRASQLPLPVDARSGYPPAGRGQPAVMGGTDYVEIDAGILQCATELLGVLWGGRVDNVFRVQRHDLERKRGWRVTSKAYGTTFNNHFIVMVI